MPISSKLKPRSQPCSKTRNTGGQPCLADEEASDPLSEALADIGAFESVGAISFDVSIVGEARLDGTRQFHGFHKQVPVDELRGMLPGLVDRCERELLNLIIRPRVGADRRLVQHDDLDHAALSRVSDFAFRIVETSPGSYQAWLCVMGADEEVERRLKKFAGADVGANGGTRIAGSLNVKEQRRGPDRSYPRVRLLTSRQCILDVEEIARMMGTAEMPPLCFHSGAKITIADARL